MTWMTPLIVAGGVVIAFASLASAEPKSLREAAGNKLLIGAAVMSHQLDDPKLANLVATQFNCLTAENEFKPREVHPSPDTFAFDAADKIVAFAEKHGMKVVGHNLLWHSQAPDFLFKDADGKPLPRQKALANLKAHIDAVAGHFKGKVIGWDVVNEAISDSPKEYLRDTPAKRAIGDDYVARAFEFAADADPGAELYYNDYSNENPEKLAKCLRLIRDLKSQGIRIDAVGIQGHFMMKYAEGTPKLLDAAIAAYKAAGVKVMITELDVEVLPRRQNGADPSAVEQSTINPYPNAFPEAPARAQAKFYGDLFAVLAKHKDAVTRVTFWGTHDGTSWLNNWPTRGRTNHPLLWDRQLQPKPAFDAVLKGVEAIAR